MWTFVGCGHSIDGWIQQVEHHMMQEHEPGEVFTMEMRPLGGPQDGPPTDTFSYTVPGGA